MLRRSLLYPPTVNQCVQFRFLKISNFRVVLSYFTEALAAAHHCDNSPYKPGVSRADISVIVVSDGSIHSFLASCMSILSSYNSEASL